MSAIAIPQIVTDCLNELAQHRRWIKSTSEMIYCTARKGVTGHETQFSSQFDRYVESVCASVQLPIGVGFGIQSQAAISQLKGQVDRAVIGTQALKLYLEKGASALEVFMRNLRNG